MEEEILKKYYDEYRLKCFELMFTSEEIKNEENPVLVWKDGKYNFRRKDESIISDKWFDHASEFKEGVAVVANHFYKYDQHNSYNFINESGELLSEKWFGNANDFCDGFARVEKDEKYNFINKEGKLLSKDYFDSAYDFENGVALVKKDDKWNYINTSGQFLSKVWFDDAEPFQQGFALVKKGIFTQYIDKKGNIIPKRIVKKHYAFVEKYTEPYSISSLKKDGYYYIVFNNVSNNIEATDIKRHALNYELIKENIFLKYKPIYNLTNHVICESGTSHYIYDKINKKYCKLGSKYEITFYNNMIINRKNKKVFYIDSDKNELIDISSIYWEKLIGLGTNELKYNYVNILSYSDFKDKCKSDDNIMSLIENEIKQLKIEKQKQEQIKREEQIKAQVIFNQQEQLRKEKESVEKLNKSLASMREALSTINNLKKNNAKRFFIAQEELLVKVDDHYEIKEEYKKALKIFDLFAIDFTNTKMSNIDFSYCNPGLLDPQKVYNKDMSNSNFTGVSFIACPSFKDVNIENTSFDDNQAESCPTLINFEGARYNDNTIFPKWYKSRTIANR